jgi:adenosine kinase
MRIFVSGSLAYDRIMNFPGKFSDHILPDKIHILNVCFLVDGLQEKFGGTAGNIAYSLTMLDEQPLVLGTGGKDFDAYARRLRQLGLSLEGVRTVDSEFTAGAYITTDQSDNQITGFNMGAMKHPSLFHFERVPPAEAIAIVSPGNLQDMQDYPRTYRELNIPYIIDPGQQIPAFDGEQLLDMITGAFALVTNDYELEMIMRASGESKADLLRRAGALVTTLGDKGCLVATGGETVAVPAVPVAKTYDPTGAGDAFRAGLLKGLTLGKDLVSAARLGATCASFCVERYGTQEHAFSLDEFRTRHRAAYGEDGL